MNAFKDTSLIVVTPAEEVCRDTMLMQTLVLMLRADGVGQHFPLYLPNTRLHTVLQKPALCSCLL